MTFMLYIFCHNKKKGSLHMCIWVGGPSPPLPSRMPVWTFRWCPSRSRQRTTMQTSAAVPLTLQGRRALSPFHKDWTGGCTPRGQLCHSRGSSELGEVDEDTTFSFQMRIHWLINHTCYPDWACRSLSFFFLIHRNFGLFFKLGNSTTDF